MESTNVANGWTEPEIRKAFLDTLEDLVREQIPYIWGGKYPRAPTPPSIDAGLDCSGAYCFAMSTVGIVPAGYGILHNAATLHARFEVVDEADLRPGDAVFYGPKGIVDHVMAWTGDGRVVGCSGGGRACSSAEVARRIGAGMHYRDIASYRRDVIGYGRLPVNAALRQGDYA
jgi:hypothetical protein